MKKLIVKEDVKKSTEQHIGGVLFFAHPIEAAILCVAAAVALLDAQAAGAVIVLVYLALAVRSEAFRKMDEEGE